MTAAPTLPVAPTIATCGSAASLDGVAQERAGLVVDDGGGEGVAVRHADVGAAAERDPARGHRGGQGAEPHDVAAEGAGLVDRTVNAGAAFAGGGEQVARAEGHEHDVADLRAADVDAGHGDRAAAGAGAGPCRRRRRARGRAATRRGRGPRRGGLAGGR